MMHRSVFHLLCLVACLTCTTSTITSTITSTSDQNCLCKDADDEGPAELSCSGQHLAAMPTLEDLHCDCDKINLSINEIRAISRADFQAFPQLRILILGANMIRELDKDSFVTLVNLEEIDLSENSLPAVDPDIFAANTKLQQVKLSGNPLVALSTTTSILNSPSVVVLDLHDCKLTDLNKAMFANLPNLKKLDLTDNNMRTLSPATFHANPRLRLLDLSNNRWQCGCSLRGIVEFSRTLRGGDDADDDDAPRGPIRCFGPDQLMRVWSSTVANTFCPVAGDVTFHVADESRLRFYRPGEMSDVGDIENSSGVDRVHRRGFDQGAVNGYFVWAVLPVAVVIMIVALGFTVCLMKRCQAVDTPLYDVTNGDRSFPADMKTFNSTAPLIAFS